MSLGKCTKLVGSVANAHGKSRMDLIAASVETYGYKLSEFSVDVFFSSM
jgi:hypothetical protein